MKKIFLACVTLLLLAAGFGLWHWLNRPVPVPLRHAISDYNVVVVMIDTLRADHLETYGYTRETAPFISQLASEGALFEKATSPAPWTREAISSLFSGMLPSHSGSIGWDARPQTEPDTAAEIFKKAGYKTGCAANTIMIQSTMYTQGFDTAIFPVNEPQVSGMGKVLTSQALDWVEECGEDKFFLYLHYLDPHAPYEPPASYLRQFTEAPHADPVEIYEDKVRSNLDKYIKEGFGPGDPRFEDMINRYDAEIRQTDDDLRAFFQGLEAMGQDQHTIVVIVSDHGEEFLEHGFIEHGWAPYEESLRVPLIFWAPRELPPTRVAERVSTVNLLPSLLALTGLEHDCAHMDGQSLFQRGNEAWGTVVPQAPVIAEMAVHHRGIFRVFYDGETKYIAAQHWLTLEDRMAVADIGAQVLGEYKTGKRPVMDIWGPVVHEEMYDLKNDPLERENLLMNSGYTVPENLKRLYTDYKAKCEAAAPRLQLPHRGSETYTPEMQESIKSLGYL